MDPVCTPLAEEMTFTIRVQQQWKEMETRLQASMDQLDAINRQIDTITIRIMSARENNCLPVMYQLEMQHQVLDATRQIYLQYSSQKAEELKRLSELMEEAGIALPGEEDSELVEEDFYLSEGEDVEDLNMPNMGGL